MKHIGILTFQNANNHGALLQAYALQYTLENLGATADIINYDSPQMQLGSLQTAPFKTFTEQFLHLTSPSCNSDEIDTALFDMIITGSDQVWNPDIIRDDLTYFLDFAGADTVKASYAASIGISGDSLNFHADMYHNLLKDFRAISIREDDQKEFIKDVTGRYPDVNIDPTLLLEKDIYEHVFNIPNIDDNYIFLYTNNLDARLINFANTVSYASHFPIIAAAGCDVSALTPGSVTLNNIGPVEWMTAIRNARLVITDAFHGTMLSLIFETPFYVYTPLRQGTSRITGMLEKTGLSERTLKSITTVKDIDYNIDFSRKREFIQAEKQKGISYLQSLINEL